MDKYDWKYVMWIWSEERNKIELRDWYMEKGRIKDEYGLFVLGINICFNKVNESRFFVLKGLNFFFFVFGIKKVKFLDIDRY